MIDAAAVYVCPISDGGGTKLKVLDAFAMEKCVVAHPMACEGIDVTSGRDVVFAVDPDEWVAKIDELLSDESARRRIGNEARTLVESKYSFAAIGARLADLFGEVAQPHDGRRPSSAR
jgi:glycosyltransferase involved in cell wall biosynthesis